MPLSIENKQYQIDQKLLHSLESFIESEYEKLDEGLRFGAKAVAREILRRMEKTTREKTKDAQQALVFRPEKKEDAVLFLVHRLMIILGVFLNHASIEIRTSEDGCTIIGAEIEGPTGRQVVTDGNLRVRQDNGLEVSR